MTKDNNLQTILDLFTKHNVDRIATKDLAAMLPESLLSNRTFGNTAPINAKTQGRAIARILKPYNWHSRDLNVNNQCVKGYWIGDAPKHGS